MTRVPFLDLSAQYQSIKSEIDAAIAETIRTNRYILGTDETPFEQAFARAMRVNHAVGCSCGTSALFIGLMGMGIARGEEVLVPSMTYPATAEAVALAGAIPVPVDVDLNTGLLDIAAVQRAVTSKTWGVIPVHLYGQMADMPALMSLADTAGLHVLEDAAQAHGSDWDSQPPGSFGSAAAYSFFPGKNLGAYGDAGAVVTNDGTLASWMRQYRNHGRTDKYRHDFVGFNFRLDGLQAAVLAAKLGHLEQWTERRREIADKYRRGLEGSGVRWLAPQAHSRHVYHLFVIRHPERDRLRKQLLDKGIECGIHYPIPLHLQPAFASEKWPAGSKPNAETLAREVLSLPIFPEMTAEQIDSVIQEVRAHA